MHMTRYELGERIDDGDDRLAREHDNAENRADEPDLQAAIMRFLEEYNAEPKVFP